MTASKKYIAKSFYLWMVRFLRLKYRQVDMVFIAHDTEAKALSRSEGQLTPKFSMLSSILSISMLSRNLGECVSRQPEWMHGVATTALGGKRQGQRRAA